MLINQSVSLSILFTLWLQNNMHLTKVTNNEFFKETQMTREPEIGSPCYSGTVV